MFDVLTAACRPDAYADIAQQETNFNLLPAGQSNSTATLSVAPINGTGSGSRSPVENWELDCEVCGRKGINQVSFSSWGSSLFPTAHLHRTMAFPYCAVVHVESGNILFAMTSKTQ